MQFKITVEKCCAKTYNHLQQKTQQAAFPVLVSVKHQQLHCTAK
jgi:hypothetical protein